MSKHSVRPVAVQVEHFTSGVRTWILHRCDCGCERVKTTWLSGSWTLAQITGEPTDV